jgi:hypothetical protein
MKLVILPQAFRNMLPVFLTQTIILFQDHLVVYAIGAYDMLKGFETAARTWAAGGSLPAGRGSLFPDVPRVVGSGAPHPAQSPDHPLTPERP